MSMSETESEPSTSAPKERSENLAHLAVSPGVWLLHFLACYATAAVYCARAGRDASLSSVRALAGGYTLLALAAVIRTGVCAHRRYRRFYETTAHDFDTPAARHGFLGFADLLLSLLSAVAVVYVALPFVWVSTCQ